jgi:serine/threonine protein kinase
MAAVVNSLIIKPVLAFFQRWTKSSTTSNEADPLEITTTISAEQSTPTRGSIFSDVFIGLFRKKQVCVKRLRIFEAPVTRERIHQSIMNDAKTIWKTLKHKNILQLEGIDTTVFKPMLAIVLPWCENGNLIQYLQRETGERDHLDRYIDGVAQGLSYLHGRSLVHGDIRGANVMIDDKGIVKLTDYGLITYAEDAISHMAVPTNRCGGGRWMAPELHHPEKFNLPSSARTIASDVFAFGMLVLEIYTEQPPFFDISHNATVYFKIVDGDRPSKPSEKQCPGNTAPPGTIWALVERCWAQKPSVRPLMNEVSEELKREFVRVKHDKNAG